MYKKYFRPCLNCDLKVMNIKLAVFAVEIIVQLIYASVAINIRHRLTNHREQYGYL